jgi:hypothetical protein
MGVPEGGEVHARLALHHRLALRAALLAGLQLEADALVSTALVPGGEAEALAAHHRHVMGLKTSDRGPHKREHDRGGAQRCEPPSPHALKTTTRVCTRASRRGLTGHELHGHDFELQRSPGANHGGLHACADQLGDHHALEVADVLDALTV